MTTGGTKTELTLVLNDRNINSGIRKVKRGLKSLGGSAKKTAGSVDLLSKAVQFLASGLLISQVGSLANQWTEAENRLRVYIDSSQELKSVQEGIFKIAQRTFTEYDPLVGLFNKLLIAKNELGASTPDLLKFTETVAKAIALSGRSANDIRGPLLQLGQLLSTGRVYAEELNSVVEGIPALARAVSKGLFGGEGSVGLLKKAGRNVKNPLSSVQFFGAGLSQAQELDEQFQRVQVSLGKGWTTLGNAVLRYVGHTDQALGASNALGLAMVSLAKHIEGAALAMTILVGSIALTKIGALITLIKVGLVGAVATFLALPIIGQVVAIGVAIASLLALFKDFSIVGAHGPATLGQKLQATWEVFGYVVDGLVEEMERLYDSFDSNVDKIKNKTKGIETTSILAEIGTALTTGIGFITNGLIHTFLLAGAYIETFFKVDFTESIKSGIWEATNSSLTYLQELTKTIGHKILDFLNIDIKDTHSKVQELLDFGQGPDAVNPHKKNAEEAAREFQATLKFALDTFGELDFDPTGEFFDNLSNNFDLVADLISKRSAELYNRENPIHPPEDIEVPDTLIKDSGPGAVADFRKTLEREHQLARFAGEKNAELRRTIEQRHKILDLEEKEGRLLTKKERENIIFLSDQKYYLTKSAEIRDEALTAEDKMHIALERSNKLLSLGHIEQSDYDRQRESFYDEFNGEADLLKEEIKLLQQKGAETELIKKTMEAIEYARDPENIVPKGGEELLVQLTTEKYYLEQARDIRGEISNSYDEIIQKGTRLLNLRNRGNITEEVYLKSIEKIEEAYIDLAAQEDRHFGDLLNSIDAWGQKVEDVFVQVVQTGKLSFRELADSIIADLIRIQVREAITRPLVDFGRNVAADFFGNAFAPAASGGRVLTDPTLNAPRASGGSVIGRNSYLVGERGPELFSPSEDGRILPNHQLNRSTSGVDNGGVRVVINNYASGAQVNTRSNQNSEGGIDLEVMIEAIENNIASNIQKGRGIAPTLEETYGFNPAQGNLR